MTSEFRRERRQRLAQERADLDYGKVKSVVAATEFGPLPADQREILGNVVETLAHLQLEMARGAGIRDVRRILGWTSEKTRDVLGSSASSAEEEEEDDDDDDDDDDNESDDDDDGGESKRKRKKKRRKKRTTGRRPASDYTGATVIEVQHESLTAGDDCPDPHCDGRVYLLPDPATIIRITGVAPLGATRYELERLRCNLCGTVYTAQGPDDCRCAKYDETVPAMVGLFRYAYGLPHYRVEKLGENLGVPFPSSTQWDVVNSAADDLLPAFDELVLQAAQGRVIVIDDTYMKVLELNASLDEAYKAVEASVEAGELPKSALKKQRTGVFTTGLVSSAPNGEIVLFLTGEKHAGENFEHVLARRAAELELPIRMADALSRNRVGDTDVLDACCLVHGRRQFVDVASSFPDEVKYVLEKLRLVFRNDGRTKRAGMTDDERLAYHQKHSKPVMDELRAWMKKQIDQRLVEPNSGLGAAIAYLDDHWDRLTLFLRVAGAPIDSNLVERALKLAIRHRKNSLFYRSARWSATASCR